MTLITAKVVGTRALLLKLEKAKRGAQAGFRAGINAAIIDVASEAKRLVHGPLVLSHTGNLSRSISSRMLSDTKGLVFVGREAPYGEFVNNGTRPHVITAVNAKALRFTIGGTVLFRKSVNHPGIRARHFMETALANRTENVKRLVANYTRLGTQGKFS